MQCPRGSASTSFWKPKFQSTGFIFIYLLNKYKITEMKRFPMLYRLELHQ